MTSPVSKLFNHIETPSEKMVIATVALTWSRGTASIIGGVGGKSVAGSSGSWVLTLAAPYTAIIGASLAWAVSDAAPKCELAVVNATGTTLATQAQAGAVTISTYQLLLGASPAEGEPLVPTLADPNDDDVLLCTFFLNNSGF